MRKSTNEPNASSTFDKSGMVYEIGDEGKINEKTAKIIVQRVYSSSSVVAKIQNLNEVKH